MISGFPKELHYVKPPSLDNIFKTHLTSESDQAHFTNFIKELFRDVYNTLHKFNLDDWALQVFASFLRYLAVFRKTFSTKHFIWVKTAHVASQYGYSMTRLEDYGRMIGNI